MEKWLIFGLLAALCYGASAFLSKLSTSDKHFAVSQSVFMLLMLVGIAIVFVANAMTDKGLVIPSEPLALGACVAAGILWALGMAFTVWALAGGADISRLTPIYNTNTLVAVILGILVLGELPSSPDRLKVLAGAILIVIGGILVSG